jgi:hypothetical protein
VVLFIKLAGFSLFGTSDIHTICCTIYMGNGKTESKNKTVTGGQHQVVWSKLMQRSIMSCYELYTCQGLGMTELMEA